MISIKRSLDAYEAHRDWAAQSAVALGEVVQVLDRFAVDAGPSATEQYRARLRQLLDRLRSAAGRNESYVEEFQSDLGAILRTFREQAGIYIGKLQSDLKMASEALCELLRSVSNGGEVATGLTGEVNRLRSLARLDDLRAIRTGIEGSVSRLTDCVGRLHREKEVIVAQLQSEITTLQQRLEEARRAAAVTSSAGAIGKPEFRRLLRREVSAGRKVGVMHVRMVNLEQTATYAPESVIADLRLAFSKNLVSVVPVVCMTQWSNDAFCLVVAEDSLRTAPGKILQECSGTYHWTDKGQPRKSQLRVRVTCLNIRPNEDSDGVLEKLESLQNT